MTRLPIDLDAITIQSPCTVPWESMKGNERKRFCGQCRLHVHDISQLTRPEAVALLEEAGGKCCLRLWRRPDGTVVTKDCGRVRLAIERRMLWLRAVAATALSALGLGGCRADRVEPRSPGPGVVRTTGVVAPPPQADVPGPTTGSPPFPPPPTSPRPDGAVPTIGR